MDRNFYNIASDFWSNRFLGCASCSNRDKSNIGPNEISVFKPKSEQIELETNETPVNSSSKNSLDPSNSGFSEDMTSFSLPIKFSGNPKGKSWTKEEDELLLLAVKMYNAKNWKLIATKVPGRSSTQCSQRWRRIQPYKNRFPWSIEEDNSLMELVQKYGQNWSIIASSLPGRTGKQVRERYLNNLDPLLNRSKFSLEEDEKIIELYVSLGPKWKEISKNFVGRTENMIKNRFYSHIKKKLLLKYPQKYKKALEKAQTEISYPNLSSPKENAQSSYKKENEKLSVKIDEFSEFEPNSKLKIEDFDFHKMEFYPKISSDDQFKQIHNDLLPQDQENGLKMEMEFNNNKINDGFLTLYRNMNETPKKSQKAHQIVYSPIAHKNLEHTFDLNLANHEKESETNIQNNDFLAKNDLINLYENELHENQNTILKAFLNLQKFENRDVFGNNDENFLQNQEMKEKLFTQIERLQIKKSYLETIIKGMLGKIDQTNTQNLQNL